MDSKSGEMEQDLKNRMKNVKQWFHRVKTEEEKKDFIFDFINKLTVNTLKKPRIVVFFNQKTYLELIYNEMRKDPRFAEIENEIAVYHGDIEISLRKKLRADFDNGKLNVLLTTNLVARGIDFYEVTAVIQCDVPIILKERSVKDKGPILVNQIDTPTYIHRVGRAGRSNKMGASILVSNQQGEDQIIALAKALDVQIHAYENFNQVKDHVDECQKHNQAVNSAAAASFDKTWTQLGVSEQFQEHLIKMKFPSPRPAQVKSVPKILNFKINEEKFYSHVTVFGFANGRGKTLCFSVPLIQSIDSSNPSADSRDWAPQAIIVAHTKDLCQQIGQVIQSILPPHKNAQITYLFGGAENECKNGSICIGTPGSIESNMRRMKTNKLKFLIIDEADEVIDNNKNEMKNVMRKVYDNLTPGFQLILFSATFETADMENLYDVIDDAEFNQDDIQIESYFEI